MPARLDEHEYARQVLVSMAVEDGQELAVDGVERRRRHPEDHDRGQRTWPEVDQAPVVQVPGEHGPAAAGRLGKDGGVRGTCHADVGNTGDGMPALLEQADRRRPAVLVDQQIHLRGGSRGVRLLTPSQSCRVPDAGPDVLDRQVRVVAGSTRVMASGHDLRPKPGRRTALSIGPLCQGSCRLCRP